MPPAGLAPRPSLHILSGADFFLLPLLPSFLSSGSYLRLTFYHVMARYLSARVRVLRVGVCSVSMCVCVCVCLLVSVCIFEQIKWNYIFLCDALNVICIRILQATIFTNECSPVPFAWSLVLGPWGLGPLENQTSGCWTNHLNCPTSQQTNRPAELTTFAKILSYPFQPSLRALKVPFCHWVLFLLLPLLFALIPPAVICICLSSFPLTGINICFRLIIFFCCLLYF